MLKSSMVLAFKKAKRTEVNEDTANAAPVYKVVDN